MAIKRLWVAAGLCLLLSGMRDPFQPPEESCQSMQSARWHYHGLVTGGQAVGFLRDADARWQRAVAGEHLSNGWRVVSVQAEEIIIALAQACSPGQWRLKREGSKSEKMDSGPGAQRVVDGLGADAEPRHADAG